MENLIEGLNNIADFIKVNGYTLLTNPITWVVVVIVSIGIYGLYDVSDTIRQNGLASVVRQLIQTILDTTGDLINAVRSLTGFIGVLRQLLFGQLNDKTLFILINYAIVFLSMASFTTTFSGLSLLVNLPLAAFISFGLQVSILIYTTRIQKMKKGREDNIKRYRNYYLNPVDETSIGFTKGKKVIGENTAGKDEKPGKQDLNGEKIKKGKKKKNLIKGLKIVVLTILLIPSVILSSFFSYVFMFDKFIKGQLVYDDHFRSITVAHEISNEYSEDISIYVSEITGVLSQYNDKVEEWMNLLEDNPMSMQRELERLNNQIDECDDKIREQELVMQSVEMTDPEYGIADSEIRRLTSERKGYVDDRNEINNTILQDTIYQNRLEASESIQLLTEFYGNPLYLVEGNLDDVRRSFSALRRAEASYLGDAEESENIQFDDEMARQIEKVFESYIALNSYFSSQNKYGIDFSNISSVFGEIEYNENMTEEEYRRKTDAILLEMIEIMNKVPILNDLQNIWTGEKIKAPEQSEYIDQIYDLYRDNNGQSESLERALKKLFGRNREKNALAIELSLIAIMVDLIIVWLTFLRENKKYNSDVADLRRLIGILFIDDSMSKEGEKRVKEQAFCMTIGIIGGVLAYMLYKIGGNGRNSNGNEDIFVFLFFILIGLAIALLTYKIYYKVQVKRKNWEDETLYLKWKEVWKFGIGTEKELEKRINDFKTGRVPSEIELDEKDTESIIRLWKEEKERTDDEESIFKKYFYENMICLMEHLEMRKCYKTTFTRTRKKKNVIKLDFISEEVMLPCVSEEDVKGLNLEMQFSFLRSKELIFYDCETNQGTDDKKYFILSERFWNLLYDAVLIRVVGGRLNEWDIEEEMQDYGEEEDDF